MDAPTASTHGRAHLMDAPTTLRQSTAYLMEGGGSTPSARLVAAAQAARVVVDADGRRLAVRRLGALDKLRLFKAVGPALAQNDPYLGMALLAWSVTAIDDVPVPQPTSEAQIEHVVQWLGDGGIAALADALCGEAAPAAAEMVAGAGN